MVDAVLATAVLTGLVLNAALGWWWADPAAGYVLVFYAAREVRDIVRDHHLAADPGEPLNQDTRPDS
jgi:divalent metal cation (Fe/Co/Zn/Cd) transporter